MYGIVNKMLRDVWAYYVWTGDVGLFIILGVMGRLTGVSLVGWTN